MTTTSADDKAPDKGSEPAFDPDEADRFAALIKPAWEEEEAPPAATASRTSVDDARPTAIDPVPNIDVGDTLPTDNPPIIDAEALVASVEGPAPSKGPAPSAKPGSTRMGIGTEDDVAAVVAAAAASKKAGATQLGLGSADGDAPPPAAEPDEDLIATQARPVASVPPSAPISKSAPRPAAGARAPHGVPDTSGPFVRASTPIRTGNEDPIELPMNRGGGLGTKIAIAAGAAIAVLVVGIVVLKSGGDAQPTPPPTPAATTAAPAAKPEITPPPLAPEPAKTAASEPAKAEPSAAPPPEPDAAKTDPPKAEPPKTPPKADNGGKKPPTPPPGGGQKPPQKGGIIRDAPF